MPKRSNPVVNAALLAFSAAAFIPGVSCSNSNKSGSSGGEASLSGGSSSGGSGGGLAGLIGALPFQGAGDVAKGMKLGGALMQFVDADAIANDPAAKLSFGESIAVAVTNQTPLTANESLNRYVTLVGLVLVKASNNPDLDMQFGVVESDKPNAVSAPHGAIFITTGAIKRLRDESELAGVLAHEISHVLKNHGMKAYAEASKSDAFVRGLSAASNDAARWQVVIDGGVEAVVVKGYDKKTEFEADAAAAALCRSAGYDPAGLQRFLERLEQESPSRDGGISGLMSTHPGRPERIDRLKKLAGGATGATMPERFAASTR